MFPFPLLLLPLPTIPLNTPMKEGKKEPTTTNIIPKQASIHARISSLEAEILSKRSTLDEVRKDLK